MELTVTKSEAKQKYEAAGYSEVEVTNLLSVLFSPPAQTNDEPPDDGTGPKGNHP